jgi:hypothetical protein
MYRFPNAHFACCRCYTIATFILSKTHYDLVMFFYHSVPLVNTIVPRDVLCRHWNKVNKLNLQSSFIEVEIEIEIEIEIIVSIY